MQVSSLLRFKYTITLSVLMAHCSNLGERHLLTEAMSRHGQVTIEGNGTLGACHAQQLRDGGTILAVTQQDSGHDTSSPMPTTNHDSLFAALNVTPTFVNNFDRDDTAQWESANWANGGLFGCAWSPTQINFNGLMTITLQRRNQAFFSGEYRSRLANFSYGYYEVRMQPARGEGLMSGSFFIYTGIYGQGNHQDIDIEVLGRNCSIQFNHYGSGQSNHIHIINNSEQSRDFCSAFNNYGFVWRPNSIIYYVNGREVYSVMEDIPSRPGRVALNLWNGTSAIDGWLEHFNYSVPIRAQYDWVKYAPIQE